MNGKSLSSFVAATYLLLACCPGAGGAILSFEAFLDGSQVVPPNASPGSGDTGGIGSYATLNDVTGFFGISNGSYQDLLGGATSVSLNDGAPGSNGPVIASLGLLTPGSTVGNFNGGATLTPTQIADMMAGNTYVIIRSQVFPAGEIRGQLNRVPEPSTLILAALGGLALLAWRRQCSMRSRA